MFTGIVEELAQIKTIEPKKQGTRYTIVARTVMDDLKIGDSISVNGVCLTVIDRKKDRFSMDLVEETLDKSNLGELITGDYVNLERAVNLYPKKIGKFHIMLSEMYLDSNNFKDALEHAKIAERINPGHVAPKQLIEIIHSKSN